jgi:4-diphosphocytidyl-2-C-methyl-D-erythritol kinase
MVCFPNSKINLGLDIIEKRNDGYHTIESVFLPVKWCDALEVVEDGSRKSEDGSRKPEDGGRKTEKEIKFSVSGLKIDGEMKNNLCVKAYHLLRKDFKLPSIKLHLHKIIPMGAGLGGGSSDAAFTLKLLNELFHLKLTNEHLKNYAKQIGSDCAFFIDNIPAFASGKGDELEKINLNLKGLFILIVKPAVHISTADAYRMIKPGQPKRSLKERVNLPLIEWKNFLKNDFEKCVFQKHPLVADLKNKMYQQGALYSSMSGSGSAVYGIFGKKNFDKNIFKKCITWEGTLD